MSDAQICVECERNKIYLDVPGRRGRLVLDVEDAQTLISSLSRALAQCDGSWTVSQHNRHADGPRQVHTGLYGADIASAAEELLRIAIRQEMARMGLKL